MEFNDSWEKYYVAADRLSAEKDSAVLEKEWSIVDNTAAASAILLNENCPQVVIDQVCATHTHRVREHSWESMCMRAVASRGENTSGTWDALFEYGSSDVVEVLAGNSATPPHIVTKLARCHTEQNILRGVAGNNALPYSELIRFLKKHCPPHNDADHVDLKGLPYVMNALQRSDLSADQEREVMSIAMSGLVNLDSWRILEGKAVYVNAWVRAIAHHKLAETRNTVQDSLFDLLWSHGDRFSYYGVMEGLQAVTISAEVSIDRLEKVWEAYCSGGKVQLESVVEILLENPDCPIYILLEACSNPNASLRFIAAEHPNCPEEGKITSALLSLT